MKRKPFEILWRVSLVMFLVTVGVAVCSFYVAVVREAGRIISRTEVRQWGLAISGGTVVVSEGTLSVTPPSSETDALLTSKSKSTWKTQKGPPFASPESSFAGFGLTRFRIGGPNVGVTRNEYFIPLWAVAMLFAWLPLVRLRRYLIVRFPPRPKYASGRCRCGYDLTGNVSGVCPECGRRVQVWQ